MTNEEYLIASYFTMAVVSIFLGVLTYGLLWTSFKGATKAYPDQGVGEMLRRSFMLGLVFPSMMGFISVSYKTCKVDTYEKVIEKRTYLVDKNLEQMAAILEYLVIAILVWAAIVSAGIIIRKLKEAGNGSSANHLN